MNRAEKDEVPLLVPAGGFNIEGQGGKMEKRWVSLETLIGDRVYLPNEIEEISKQVKTIFYSWDGFTIQSIEGYFYDTEFKYLDGDITFICEIVPGKCRISIYSLDEIAKRYDENTGSAEEMHNLPFLLSSRSFIPCVELPRIFLPARRIFARIDKLNQVEHEGIRENNPRIDQRSETSYKTILAALLAHAGKYPFGVRGGKAAAVKWLVREIEKTGCAMSEKTIGKHLEGLPDALKKKEIAPISRK